MPRYHSILEIQIATTLVCSVADPDPPDPHIFLDPDSDPSVRGMDPAPAVDPDPSITKQKK